MPDFIEFKSTSGRPVCATSRLELIRMELHQMLKVEEKAPEMDSWPALISCLEELTSTLDEFLDYDPTPQYLYDNTGGEPPLSAEEIHSGAWKQHVELHS
jgi:hypothetical protein